MCRKIRRLQNSRFFFSKSVKKSVKRGVRFVRARSARASHALRACEARGKKTTVRFPYNEFVLTRGFKNVVELSKICSQLRPLCESDTPGDWFRGRIQVLLSKLGFESWRCNPVILTHFYRCLSVKCSIYSGGSKMSGSGSTPKN